MGFRTVEITGPAELHVRSGSLIVEKELKIGRRIDNINDSKARKRTKKEPQVDKVVIPLLLQGAENGT